jgi:hypothetical protein
MMTVEQAYNNYLKILGDSNASLEELEKAYNWWVILSNARDGRSY